MVSGNARVALRPISCGNAGEALGAFGATLTLESTIARGAVHAVAPIEAAITTASTRTLRASPPGNAGIAAVALGAL